MNRGVHPEEAISADVSIGQWNDTVCSCTNQMYPSCICSFLCPCIIAGQIAEKLQYRKFGSVLSACCLMILATTVLSIITSSPLFFIFFWMCVMYYAWHIRTLIRQQYLLPGGPSSDCCLSSLCSCCVLAQVTYLFHTNTSKELL